MRACETLFRMKNTEYSVFSGIPLQRRLQLAHEVRQLRAAARLRPPLADVETKLYFYPHRFCLGNEQNGQK